MKIEKGVMVIKNGKGWGYYPSEGHGDSGRYGWMILEDAEIHDPRYCETPTDLTYKGSPYWEQLASAELVKVERKTEVIIK